MAKSKLRKELVTAALAGDVDTVSALLDKHADEAETSECVVMMVVVLVVVLVVVMVMVMVMMMVMVR